MKKIRITYIGRRLRGSSLTHVFLNGKKEVAWSGVRGLCLGHVYEAECLATGKLRISLRPTSLGIAKVPVETHEEWEALELADVAGVRERRLRAKARRNSSLLLKLEPLRPVLERLSYLEKRAFLELVLDRFTITRKADTRSLRNSNKDLRKALARALARESKAKVRRGDAGKKAGDDS